MIYHIFTDNTDEYTLTLEEAYKIYNLYVAEYNCARLYEEKRDENDEILSENCIESHGHWPY